jgi:glutaredoxin
MQLQHPIVIITNFDDKNSWNRTRELELLMNKHKLKYSILDSSDDDDEVAIKKLKASSNLEFPSVFINDKFIGGMTDILYLSNNNKIHDQVRYYIADRR